VSAPVDEMLIVSVMGVSPSRVAWLPIRSAVRLLSEPPWGRRQRRWRCGRSQSAANGRAEVSVSWVDGEASCSSWLGLSGRAGAAGSTMVAARVAVCCRLSL
jgi:hypothetical protein